MKRSLRTLARNQPCHLRLVGCSHDREQTVLAHVRRGGIAGMGQKPCDVAAFPCCDHCHGIFDGRYKAHGMTRAELDAEGLRALAQWLDYLWRHEYLILGGITA
jgi:hypothetical protein